MLKPGLTATNAPEPDLRPVCPLNSKMPVPAYCATKRFPFAPNERDALYPNGGMPAEKSVKPYVDGLIL